MTHRWIFVTAARLFVVAMGSGLCLAAHAQEAVFEGLGDLPGGTAFSAARGVSADGRVVVGTSGSTNGQEAFRWEAGSLAGLGDLQGGAFASLANDVSADGTVVVGRGLSGAGLEAFRWEGGRMMGLGDLPAGPFFSTANAVSADGAVVVGTGASSMGEEAFRWEAGVMSGLGYLPGFLLTSQGNDVTEDGSVAVGTSYSEAFRWEDGTLEGIGSLPNAQFGVRANAITRDGSVIVGASDSNEGIQAFRWEAGDMVSLGDVPDPLAYAEALAVSLDGTTVVGFGGTDTGDEHALIWLGSTGTQFLADVLSADYGLDLTGWTLHRAWDLSDDGTVIVGDGTNPDGHPEAWRVVLANGVSAAPPPDAPALSLASFPNPARDSATLSVSLTVPGGATLDVFDVLGRSVTATHHVASAGRHTVVLPTAGWPAGTYRVRARAGGQSVWHAITVLR